MICCDFTATDWSKSKKLLQSAAMLANVLDLSVVLFLLVFSVYSLSLAYLSSSSSANLSSSYSIPLSVIHLANILRRFAAAISLSNMEASVQNGGRSTVVSATQSLCFFDLERSPTAA